MLNIQYTTQFKKDFKKLKKQHKDLSKLQSVIEILAIPEPLDPTYKDHQSTGNWNVTGHLTAPSQIGSYLSA